MLPFLRSLESAIEFGTDTDFSVCVKTLQARHRKRGLVVVISDFFFPQLPCMRRRWPLSRCVAHD